MFGVGGCSLKTNHPQEATETAWSIAKLHKLRGADLEGPIADEFVMEWAIADEILSRGAVGNQTVAGELMEKGVPLTCIDFIEHLLVVDSKRRLSAIEALTHPSLQD